MSNVLRRSAGAPTAAVFAEGHIRGRRGMRLRHVISDFGDAEHGWSARLRAAAQRRVAQELALGRESGLLVLRQGGPPRTEACTVPTQFLPMINAVHPLPVILSKVVDACADRTIVLLHGGLDDLLAELAEQLRLRDVPYAVVSHGFYVRALRSSGAVRPRAAPRSLQRTLLEAALSVEIASRHERDVVQRIAPLSRLRQDRHWPRSDAAVASGLSDLPLDRSCGDWCLSSQSWHQL